MAAGVACREERWPRTRAPTWACVVVRERSRERTGGHTRLTGETRAQSDRPSKVVWSWCTGYSM
eukprot:4306751-Prymnesium_polylepis.1